MQITVYGRYLCMLSTTVKQAKTPQTPPKSSVFLVSVTNFKGGCLNIHMHALSMCKTVISREILFWNLTWCPKTAYISLDLTIYTYIVSFLCWLPAYISLYINRDYPSITLQNVYLHPCMQCAEVYQK